MDLAKDKDIICHALKKDEKLLCRLPRYKGHYLKPYTEIGTQTLEEIFCAVSRYSKGEPPVRKKP